MSGKLEIYMPNGSLQFSSDGYRLMRVLLSEHLVTAAGSRTLSGATSQGTVVPSVTPTDDAVGAGEDITATVSGNSISWSAGNSATVNMMVY